MYAIVLSGGKQYKVEKDNLFAVDKLDAAVGDKVSLDVLMTSDNGTVAAGSPVLANAKVQAEVVRQFKGDKIIVYKYKSKKNVRKKQGHRQPYTELKVLSIDVK